MRIEVTQLTDLTNIDSACAFTVGHDVQVKSYKKLFLSEHSVIRTLIFDIQMLDIPTFASVHFVRHSCTGQNHFVKTNRPDRGGSDDVDRNTPVKHHMRLNAQHLIDMSRVRLCYGASKETRDIMVEIKRQVAELVPELAECMMPDCEYRCRCYQIKTCGYFKG